MQYSLPTLLLSSFTGLRSADDPHLFSRSGSGTLYGAGGIFATYDGETGDITTATIDKTKNYYAMSIGDQGGTLATLAVVNPTNADEIVELRQIGPGGSSGSFSIRLASDITVAKRSKHLYLALSSNRYQLRAFSGTIVASTTVTNTSSKPILAPDDSACFLPTSNSGNFVTSVLDGSSLALLRQDQGYCQGVSPDGRYSLNMRHPLGEIVLLDAKTGQLARVLEPTERAYLFASCGWSPDSKAVFHFLEKEGVKTLAAWSTETGQRVWTDTGGRTATWGVDVDPAGSRLTVSNSVEVSTMNNPVPMNRRGRPTALTTKIGRLQGRGLLDIQFQDFDTALFLAGPRTSLNGPSVVSDIDFNVGVGSSGTATLAVRTKASVPNCRYDVYAFDWGLNSFVSIGGGELPTTLSGLNFDFDDLSPFVKPQDGRVSVQIKTFAPALTFTLFSQEIDETVFTFGE